MKLLLIRHAETVDNVARVYAGITDSALTAHGALQATRLGTHLATTLPPATHVFSSDLTRARLTADAVVRAQRGSRRPRPVQLSILREQDFGSLEATKFGLPRHQQRQQRSNGVPSVSTGSKQPPGFRPVESRASMAVRASAFVDGYLLPILLAQNGGTGAAPTAATPSRKQRRRSRRFSAAEAAAAEARASAVIRRFSAPAALTSPGTGTEAEPVVMVVSHGLLLSVLWAALLERFALQGAEPPSRAGDFRHLGPWDNTGYLSLRIRPLPREGLGGEVVTAAAPAPPYGLSSLGAVHRGWGVCVMAVNCRDHLRGLKRTGGGVGSAAFDPKQRGVGEFFGKKARTG